MKPTGSKIHRVWKCPASAVLPQSYRDDSKHEPARQRGQHIHHFLERVKTVGRAVALTEAPADLLPLLEALDLENLPVHLACEVAFAWNWREGTARELGRGEALPRTMDGAVDYDALGIDWSCEIPCTLDVIGVERRSQAAGAAGEIHPDRGYVGDYKSGHSKYPAPDMFGQTLLGGLCVRSVFGCDDVVLELIFVHDNGGHHTARRTVGEWELDSFERELRGAMQAIEDFWRDRPDPLPVSMELVPVEGPWCEFCDAYKNCSAKLQLVKSIPDELASFGIKPDPETGALTLSTGGLTVVNAGRAWMAMERIEDVIARAKEEICSLGAYEEIPLPDGRVIGRLVTEKRAITGKIGAEVLEKTYGAAARREFVEEHVTLGALRQAAVKFKGPKEKIETQKKDGVYDRLLAEVERRGGLELKVTDAVRPHVPKKKR
jgi:hypothetical protein